MSESIEDQQKAVLEWMHNGCQGSLILDGVERSVNPVVVKALQLFNLTINDLTAKLSSNENKED